MNQRLFRLASLLVGTTFLLGACAADTDDEASSEEAPVTAHVAGTRVESFGENGVDRSPSSDAVYGQRPASSFVDAKGRKLSVVKEADSAPSVERRLSDGRLDTSFGDNGIALLAGFDQDADAVVKLLPDDAGRFLALRVDRNEYRYGGTKTQLARFREDGVADPTFAKAGYFKESVLDHEEALATVVRSPSSGKYFLIGSRAGISEVLIFQTGCYLDTYVLELDKDGERVRSFDQDGVVVHRFTESSEVVNARLIGKDQLEILGVEVKNKGWANRCHKAQADSDGPRYAARIWL